MYIVDTVQQMKQEMPEEDYTEDNMDLELQIVYTWEKINSIKMTIKLEFVDYK